MKVVVIAARKGGSGKTTLAGHLAVQAERAGHGPVALIDIDSQGSLSAWWNGRAAPTPVFVQTTSEGLAGDLVRLRDLGIKVLGIDTPPALGETISDVVKLANLVVIPTRPSPHDLRSIGATAELVERLGKPLVFVLNGATPRARINGEALDVLSRHGMLAPVILHQRIDFAASMIDGRTVMELPDSSRSSEEVEKLWTYVNGRLVGAAPRPRLPSLPRRPAEASDLAMAGAAREGSA
jgi:chromosome partitioning protein